MSKNMKNEITRIAIIGAGLSGICAAIRLRQSGFKNVTLYERDSQPGGTWNRNTYPGCACDVPSVLYSYSFALNPSWTKRYATQPEILEYIQNCIDRYQLDGQIRCNMGVRSASFNEQTSTWKILFEDQSTAECDVLISAVGQLDVPYIPQIVGAESFEGDQFHSARWQENCDLKDKNVAIVGNAASAIQLLKPVAEQARQTTVYQRSPQFIAAKNDWSYSNVAQKLFALFPLSQRIYRAWTYFKHELRYLALRKPNWLNQNYSGRLRRRAMRTVPVESGMWGLLIPEYRAGCKRVLLSDDYYQTVQRDDVKIISSGIEKIDAAGVFTGGKHHSADVIIFATGFRTNPLLSSFKLTGRNGLDLNKRWQQAPKSYLGMMVPGFPNFFMLYGPNTNLGHNSILFMVECQANYIIKCLQNCERHSHCLIEVREASAEQYQREVNDRLRQSIWSSGCSNWYQNEAGEVITNWSETATEYWLRTRRIRKSDFQEHLR